MTKYKKYQQVQDIVLFTQGYDNEQGMDLKLNRKFHILDLQ